MNQMIEDYKGFKIVVRSSGAGQYIAHATKVGVVEPGCGPWAVGSGKGAKKQAIASLKETIDQVTVGKSELDQLLRLHEIGTRLTDEVFRKIRRAAGKAVARAVKAGKLKKMPCAKCGSTENLEAHHESYKHEDWLKVMWLCRDCHSRFYYSRYYCNLQQKPSTDSH